MRGAVKSVGLLVIALLLRMRRHVDSVAIGENNAGRCERLKRVPKQPPLRRVQVY